jgi:hypothetical protein
MNKLHPFLMALCAATIFSPAVASNTSGQQTDAADARDSRPAVTNPATPHNHMRDGKGLSIPAKPSKMKKDALPAVDENTASDVDAKKKATAKKKVRPHSHPQDGKGMYVPDKK